MKVYIVGVSDEDTWHLKGICSTKEKAQELSAKFEKVNSWYKYNMMEVQEWEVDEELME